MKRFVVISIIALSSSLTSFAQYTLKFDVNKHNNIVLDAVLNEQDSLRLMFHTGISDVSVIEGSTSGLSWVEADSVESWGGTSEARVSISNQLRLGKYFWEDVNIWECQRSGPDTDGKIGLSYFSDKHVEFDFNGSQLITHNTLPETISEYLRCPLINEDGALFVELSFQIDNNSYQQRFLLHSGYGGCLLLDDAFANEHQLSEKLEIIDQSVLKDSYGNEITVNKAILPNISWNEITLEEVPVGFFAGKIARQHISVLGADFMRRFQIIVDADREFVYINASKFQNEDYSKI